MLKLSHVNKNFYLGKKVYEVLKDINLHVPRGRSLAIIGESGVGKSTLLSLIGTLDSPTSGEVHLIGKEASQLSDRQISYLRGEKIGFIFQDFNLLPQLSLYENIEIAMNGRANHQKIIRLLQQVGLEHLADHRPSQVSGGQQQRAAIARALVNEPEMILADEPTGNLDETTGEEIMDLLFNLHRKNNNTLVIVTHSSALCQRVDDVYELTPTGLHKKN